MEFEGDTRFELASGEEPELGLISIGVFAFGQDDQAVHVMGADGFAVDLAVQRGFQLAESVPVLDLALLCGGKKCVYLFAIIFFWHVESGGCVLRSSV